MKRAHPTAGATGRASRFIRGALRRPVLTTAVCLALAAAATFIVVRSESSPDELTSAASSETAAPPLAKTCQARPTREPCRDITIGGRTWRYALLEAQTKTTETVVVDFGGPGQSALSGSVGLADFRAAFPDLSNRFNLLVVEEPWVTEDLPDGCDEALTAYYRALRDSVGIDDRGAGLARACDIAGVGHHWGFTPDTYRSLVNGIRQRDGLDLRGFVGRSWASARLGYLGADAVDFAVLVRPYPVGADVTRLVTERLRRIGERNLPSAPLEAASIETRSLPVTEFDRRSALVELGYVDDRYFAENVAAVRQGTDREGIGTLSDRLWGRYGVDSLSPAILAQLQEICPETGALPEPGPATATVGGVIAASFAPCRSIAPRDAEPTTARRTCIVTSPSDSVVPDTLVRAAFGRSKTVREVVVRSRSHGSFEGLTSCLKSVDK